MNKSEITILVDMDDTIENLCDAWVTYLNNKYNLSVSTSDITEWEMTSAFPSLSKTKIYEPLHNKDFWYTITPKEDAQIYLKRLVEEGYNVFICTSTNYDVSTYKMDAIIGRYFPFIDWKQIITSHNKHMIKGDVLIDDGFHNYDKERDMFFLYDTPHNRNVSEDSSNFFRCHNWQEVYEAVEKYYDFRRYL